LAHLSDESTHNITHAITLAHDSITSQPASMVEQRSHLAHLSDESAHNITHTITLAYDSITSQPASMVEQRSHLAHLSDESTHNVTHAITLANDSITSQPASLVEQRSHLAHFSDESTHNITHVVTLPEILIHMAWFAVNAILEYLSLSVPHILYCCVVSYSCSKNYVFELCQALALRLLRFMMPRHEYSNKLKAITLQFTHKASATMFLLMFGLQFILATFISNVACGTAISGYSSWLTISEWYKYELCVTNRLIKNSSSAEPYLHSITHWYGCYCQEPSVIIYPEQVGGGKKNISLNELKPYITPYSLQPQNESSTNYKFVNQFVLQAAQAEFRKNSELLICHVPLEILKGKITLGQAKCIAKMHNIPILSKSSVAEVFRKLGRTHVLIKMLSLLHNFYSREVGTHII
jgi:hypothetical protein